MHFTKTKNWKKAKNNKNSKTKKNWEKYEKLQITIKYIIQSVKLK